MAQFQPKYPRTPREPPIIAGKVPPHDLEAEAAVLSAILLKQETLDQVAELLKPEHFYSEANGKIYEAAEELARQSQPIDTVQVASWLRDRERLAQIGGPAYLAQIVDATPAVAHVQAHARTVREKWRLRRLIAECQRVSAEGYGDVGGVQEFIDGAEQAIYELARTPEASNAQPIAQVLRAAFEQISKAAERGDRITGISTGYGKFDEKTAGLHDGDLMIVAARPGMGKCLAAETEVVLGDGRVATMREIVEAGAAELLTLDERWKLRLVRPSAFVDDGEKPVFRVTTRLGREIETTLSHPFLTVDGWKPLAELRTGVHVGVPRVLPVFGDREMRDCEVKLLGYLIGDGGLTGTQPHFTNTNPRIVADFVEAVGEFGAVTVRPPTGATSRAPTYAISGDLAVVASSREDLAQQLRAVLTSRGVRQVELARRLDVTPSLVSMWLSGQCVPNEARFRRLCEVLDVPATALLPRGHAAAARMSKNPVTLFLERHGLWGKLARDKSVPAAIFQLPRRQLAVFLNRLFATDGWATVLSSGQAQLGYSTVSQRRARQVQHLLLRFGVIASLRRRMVKYRDSRRQAFQLDITHAASVRQFVEEIGLYGKEEAAWSAVEAVSGRRVHANRDVVPRGVWTRLDRKRGRESWASVGRRAGLADVSNLHVGGRGLSRERCRALADAVGDAEIAAMSTGDVYWDEIVAIEALGPKQVYDLTIEHTHNFVASDVCVHNTSFVLNLAVNVASPRSIALPGPNDRGYGSNERREPGFGVAVFSLEMPREQLATRMVCSEARVDVGKLRGGHLTPEDWRRLTEAASYLSTLPVWLDDTPAIGLLEVRAKVRRMQAEYNRGGSSDHPDKRIGLVVIDYLQLMSGRPNANSREQEISEISRGLKQLAKELRVPVIALSQLNRAVETRTTKDKRPQLSDLRESGAIEQDADTIVFIYRDEYYNAETTDQKGIAELIIAKQRNGPTGKVYTRFTASCTRFDNLQPGDYPELSDD